MRGILVILFCGILMLSAGETAHAEIGLGVYPPTLQIQASAPASIQTPVTLTNTGATPLVVSLSFRPFRPSAAGDGSVVYQYDTTISPLNPTLSERISLRSFGERIQELTLSPGEQHELVLDIALPARELEGDYYFSIVCTVQQLISDTTTGSAIQTAVGLPVLLSVGQKGEASGTIETMRTPLFLLGGPLPVTLRVANGSNFFITPTGTVTIRNLFGATVATLPIRESAILSGSSRYMSDTDRGEQMTPPQIVWNEPFLFGVYATTATIQLTSDGPTLTATRYSIALPVWFLIAAVAIAALVTLVIVRIHWHMGR